MLKTIPPLFHKVIKAICGAQSCQALSKIPVLLSLCPFDLALIGMSIPAQKQTMLFLMLITKK